MKKIITCIFAVFVMLLSVKFAYASEGTVELASVTRENYRCFASSMQMQDFHYTILVGCRNLIYPTEDSVYHYILWASPIEGNPNPIRLGPLGLGKGQFRSSRAFSALFVSTELRGDPRQPARVVMRGNLRPINFLETAAPAPEIVQDDDESPFPEITPIPEEQTTRERLVLGLQRAGIISFVALIALIGLVFVISRSRG
jgi:hypothetical protein